MINGTFLELKRVISIASLSKKPNDQDFLKIVKPLFDNVKKLTDLKNAKRQSADFNHLASSAEGIQMVQFISSPTPTSYVAEMQDAAMFYLNKILSTFKNAGEKGKPHLDFVANFKALGASMQAYAKEFHTTGLSWNPKGGDAKTCNPTGSQPQASGSGDLPPPPPPVDHEKLRKMQEAAVKSSSSKTVDTGALFSQINSINAEGDKGLRKVSKEERNLYSKAVEKGEAGSSAATQVVKKEPPKTAKKKRITGNPILQCADNKWSVENQDGNQAIVINIEQPKQVVYVAKCDNCLIQIKGKFNTITLDDCVKTSVSFDAVVGSCDVVNCKSVKIEVMGSVPTVLIDKTDGAHVFLSKTSLATCIISSKSSEMNVSVAIGNDDYKEMAIPEQFTSTYDVKTGKLNTVVNSHLG